MNSNNVQGRPHAGPPPQNHNGPPKLNLQIPAPDLRTMEELCQPTMNGLGRPIAPVNIQATDFGLKNHMIQQVQNSCQFHGLPGDDANKHLYKFLTITQSMKQNGVTDDALRLYLFPHLLTLHATAWFDRLPKNSIHTFQEITSKFLSKYFPPSMVTKLRNDISSFRQLSNESLFEAWEHTMKRSTMQLGGTFMKRRPEECYGLIENMIAHHNDWDTSAHRGESSSSITSSSSELAALIQQMAEIRKDMLQMYRSNQQVNFMTPSCKTCGGPHYYYKCQAAGGYTQDIYATTGTYRLLTYPTTDEMLRNFMISIDAKFNSLATSVIEIKKSLQERPQGALPNNTIPNPCEEIKAITTQSGNVLAGPSVLSPSSSSSSKEVERDPRMITDQLPEKLRDPGKFLLPYVFPELEKCMALADLGANINLMPLYLDIAEDVFVQVGKFTFLADFVGGTSRYLFNGDDEIKFNPFKDIDDPVLIPRVSKTPLDSFDSSLDSFDKAFTNPLFELDSKYTLNYDNPIFDIQNVDSDASETYTIMDEVQFDSL
ncbi:reverse transcriptase domain-containing protein [Tanacetum coccineum]